VGPLESDIQPEDIITSNTFFDNTPSSPSAPKVKKDTTVDFTNDKSAHANLLFCRWQYGRTKEVFSNRLGISYSSETYHAARDATSILHLGNKHMYRKTLSNFRVTTSTNLCTKKKQEKRFERSCRRIPSFISAIAVYQQARETYHCSGSAPDAEKYRFLIPYFLKRKQINFASLGNKISSTEVDIAPVDSSSSSSTLCSVAPYNPIPDNPLYSTPDGVFIVPGSREWFTYMSTLEKKIRADITFQRTWEKALAHQRPESAKKELEIARVQKERAGYLGISVKHLRVRERETLLLTGFNDRYYEGNGEISLSTSNIMLILQSKSKYVRKCLLKYSSPEYLQKYTKHRKAHTPEDDSYILEETQALEFRPNKRDVDHNSNLLSYHVSIKQKRLRSVPIFIEDSTIYKFKLVLINCINRSQVPF
ncbi:12167_t:CDS:2, partial [Rhizophagus irregularis]